MSYIPITASFKIFVYVFCRTCMALKVLNTCNYIDYLGDCKTSYSCRHIATIPFKYTYFKNQYVTDYFLECIT